MITSVQLNAEIKARNRERAGWNLLRKAVINKIGYQFPSTPEGRLQFAVVATAIRDATLPGSKCKDEATRYLRGHMPQAEICGVESEWITNTLIKAKLIERGRSNDPLVPD